MLSSSSSSFEFSMKTVNLFQSFVSTLVFTKLISNYQYCFTDCTEGSERCLDKKRLVDKRDNNRIMSTFFEGCVKNYKIYNIQSNPD